MAYFIQLTCRICSCSFHADWDDVGARAYKVCPNCRAKERLGAANQRADAQASDLPGGPSEEAGQRQASASLPTKAEYKQDKARVDAAPEEPADG